MRKTSEDRYVDLTCTLNFVFLFQIVEEIDADSVEADAMTEGEN